MSRATLASKVPAHTLGCIRRYVDERIPPGGFVRAVLSNDLHAAFLHADEYNEVAMKHIVAYLHWEVPSVCWGSPEAVKKWLEEDL